MAAAQVTQQRRRKSRRRTRPRSRVVSIKHLRIEIAAARDLVREVLEIDRPKTRGDCDNVARPCPWVGCQHNNYLDVTATGSILFTHPELEPDQMPTDQSCALDVAGRGGMTLEEVGQVLNLTRERARQLEVRALARLREAGVDLR